MIESTWLSSVVIVDGSCQVICDIYGTSNEKVWIIQSLSKNSVTRVIDSWSY